MERSGMLSPTCSATVRLQRTKLRNEFELAHRTPQLNKHGVVGSCRPQSLLVVHQCCSIQNSYAVLSGRNLITKKFGSIVDQPTG